MKSSFLLLDPESASDERFDPAESVEWANAKPTDLGEWIGAKHSGTAAGNQGPVQDGLGDYTKGDHPDVRRSLSLHWPEPVAEPACGRANIREVDVNALPRLELGLFLIDEFHLRIDFNFDFIRVWRRACTICALALLWTRSSSRWTSWHCGTSNKWRRSSLRQLYTQMEQSTRRTCVQDSSNHRWASRKSRISKRRRSRNAWCARAELGLRWKIVFCHYLFLIYLHQSNQTQPTCI